jgi:hypothetical protein
LPLIKGHCRHFASLIARTTNGGTALYFEVAGHKSALKVKDLNPDYKQDLNGDAPTSQHILEYVMHNE